MLGGCGGRRARTDHRLLTVPEKTVASQDFVRIRDARCRDHVPCLGVDMANAPGAVSAQLSVGLTPALLTMHKASFNSLDSITETISSENTEVDKHP